MDLHLDPGEHSDEADRLLLRVVGVQPYGGLESKAKALRGGIASRELLPPGPAAFEGMDQQRFLAVLSEVGAVSQCGLQINEPGTSSGLKILPGSWSGLSLPCLIHVGLWP